MSPSWSTTSAGSVVPTGRSPTSTEQTESVVGQPGTVRVPPPYRLEQVGHRLRLVQGHPLLVGPGGRAGRCPEVHDNGLCRLALADCRSLVTPCSVSCLSRLPGKTAFRGRPDHAQRLNGESEDDLFPRRCHEHPCSCSRAPCSRRPRCCPHSPCSPTRSRSFPPREARCSRRRRPTWCSWTAAVTSRRHATCAG